MKNIDVITAVIKHLAGKHDQKRHGKLNNNRPADIEDLDSLMYEFNKGLQARPEDEAAIYKYGFGASDEGYNSRDEELGSFEMINTYLRSSDHSSWQREERQELTDYVARLDAAFENSGVVLPKATTVFRGVPEYSRSVTMPAGSVFEEPGFVSTSYSIDPVLSNFMGLGSTFTEGNVLMEIRVPAGQKIVFGPRDEEREIILNRGAKFKVISNDKLLLKNVRGWKPKDAWVNHAIVEIVNE